MPVKASRRSAAPYLPPEATPAVSVRSVALASLIGNTIEWYDFFLYNTASALVFNRLYFPTLDPHMGTLAAFATYAVGFAARPIGGIVIGHYGDRIGRKSMLVLTLVLMGVATFFMGLLPTYAGIGPWAAVLLVSLRFIQGFGVGGEWGGAVLMAVEHAPPGKRGFYGSWPQMGVPIGLILSTAVFAQFAKLPEAQFLAWGWRIPFLLSIVLVGVGLIVRLRLVESPVFTKVKQTGGAAALPISDVLRNQPRSILLAIGVQVGEKAAFFVYSVFLLSYAKAKVGLAPSTILNGLLVAAACMLVAVPCFGCAVRPIRKTTGLFVRRRHDGIVRVSAVLARRHGVDAACVGRTCVRARVRAHADVCASSGVSVRTVRYARSVHGRVVGVATLGRARRRPLPVHRDGPAAVRPRRARGATDWNGRDHDRVRVPCQGNAKPRLRGIARRGVCRSAFSDAVLSRLEGDASAPCRGPCGASRRCAGTLAAP